MVSARQQLDMVFAPAGSRSGD